jgi:hypothetical protein
LTGRSFMSVMTACPAFSAGGRFLNGEFMLKPSALTALVIAMPIRVLCSASLRP